MPALIAALVAARARPLEIVVVDGGSDDGTAELAAEQVRVITSERGRARQQNAGAEVALGAVLWFLHADSIPPPSAIDEIRGAIRSGAVGGCFTIDFPRHEIERAPSLAIIRWGINARTRVIRTGTGDQGIFVRRDVFGEIGRFPEWPLFEDVALFRQLKSRGRPAICAGPLQTSARRWLEGGIARTMIRMWALRVGFAVGLAPERLARRWDQRSAP